MFMRAEKKIFWQKKENGQTYDCHFYLTSEWCCANNEIGKEFPNKLLWLRKTSFSLGYFSYESKDGIIFEMFWKARLLLTSVTVMLGN